VIGLVPNALRQARILNTCRIDDADLLSRCPAVRLQPENERPPWSNCRCFPGSNDTLPAPPDVAPNAMLHPTQQLGLARSIVAKLLVLFFGGGAQQADIQSVFGNVDTNPDGGHPIVFIHGVLVLNLKNAKSGALFSRSASSSRYCSRCGTPATRTLSC